jgi:hypothetical protein
MEITKGNARVKLPQLVKGPCWVIERGICAYSILPKLGSFDGDGHVLILAYSRTNNARRGKRNCPAASSITLTWQV